MKKPTRLSGTALRRSCTIQKYAIAWLTGYYVILYGHYMVLADIKEGSN